MWKGLFSFSACLLFVTLVALPRSSAQVALRVESATGAQISVDGQLSEWKQIRFASYGKGVRVALAHDARGLFVAADIDDDRTVPGSRCGSGSDAVVLSMRRPARGASSVQLWLCPGERRRPASAAIRVGRSFRALGAAKVVEMKRERGYSLEAFVPWKALPDGRQWEQFEGVLGVQDVDSELKPKASVSGRIPPLKGNGFGGAPLLDMHFLGGTDGLLFNFLKHQGSSSGAKALDRWSNLHGDARAERIVVVGNNVLIMGPGYRDGENYDVMRLPIERGSDVVRSKFAELTGDGRNELLLWLRQSAGSDSRVVVMAFRFAKEPFEKVLDLEVRRQSGSAYLECELVLPKKRNAPLTQPSCEVSGYGKSHYRRWGGSNAIEIIKPWTGVSARSFVWKDGAFRMAETESEVPAPTATTKQNSGSSTTRTPVTNAGKPVSVADLMRAFKSSAGLAASAKPDDSFMADVVGDKRAERVVRFGKHIAVMGEGYLGGKQWFHYAVPVAASGDVRKLRVHDVTGNGKAELIFEFVQRIGDVERVLLAAHCLGYKGFPRVLLVEIERRQAKRSVRNSVSFKGKGSGSLVIAPGKAKGWSKGNWSFADNNDEVGPLLLPWRDKAVRYRFVRNKGLVPSN